MKTIDKSEIFGVTKGIYTFIEMTDTKNAKFKCELCDKEYVVNFYRWYHNGRQKCECTKVDFKNKLYHRYNKMLYRCYNPKSSNYSYYGGRGIKVCDRWKNSFENFLEDMQTTYFEGAELDRIDNDGDYQPSNCQWVTHSHNMLNRHGFKNKTKFPGIRQNIVGNYLGRVQINKKEYRTTTYPTPEEAYDALLQLKQRLYSEMNIANPSNSGKA